MTKDFTKVSVSGICQAKKGLLFLRDCGASATATCHACGRPVCEKHQTAEEKGPACPECIASRQESAGEDPTRTVRTGGVYRSYRRHHYYSRFGYMPFYFGHSHYYSDHDYRTFDYVDADADFGPMADGGMGDMDTDGNFDDMDDFMES